MTAPSYLSRSRERPVPRDIPTNIDANDLAKDDRELLSRRKDCSPSLRGRSPPKLELELEIDGCPSFVFPLEEGIPMDISALEAGRSRKRSGHIWIYFRL